MSSSNTIKWDTTAKSKKKAPVKKSSRTSAWTSIAIIKLKKILYVLIVRGGFEENVVKSIFGGSGLEISIQWD